MITQRKGRWTIWGWVVHLAWVGGLVGMSQAAAAECAAIKSLREGEDALVTHKNEVQRREWLLLEFLSSDKESRALYDKEAAQSAELSRAALSLNEQAMELAEDGELPAGSPECKTVAQIKASTDTIVRRRTAEMEQYFRKQFPFLHACDVIANRLVSYAQFAHDPSENIERVRATKLALSRVLGPEMYQARLSLGDFDALAARAVEAPELDDPIRYAYLALSCLKRSQRQGRGLKSMKDAASGLAGCDTSYWIELGACVRETVLPDK